jgi:methylmalonyl-CoA/ethylmalonyl-CoA epimerase
VEERALGGYAEDLERAGLRIVERGDYGDGDETAFISPRTAPGMLVQFWQVPGFHGERPSDVPAEPVAERDGVRFRVDHLALAVRSIDAALAWFRKAFPIEPRRPAHRGWDGTFNLASFWLAGYKMELLEPVREDGPVGRFLARFGEGLHHLSIDVDRIDPLLARLGQEGLRIVGKAEIGGGRKTAFVHPGDAHGVLLQFWQEPDFGARRRR